MNEEGQDQPNDHTLKNQQLREDCSAHANLDPRETGSRPITIETQGKVVGRGKKPVPSAEVYKLAMIGCKDIEIADWFGIDSNTLRYNFSVELLKGREALKQSLRRKQIDVAMSGNPTMLIFLGKNLLGQSDNPIASQEAAILPWSDE